MPLRSDWSANACPIARSLEVVGDPWVLLILREAMLGARRYEQFRAALGVADNVLSRRLQGMVDAGLLRRAPYRGEQRTHHEYQLTAAGSDLLPLLHALALWGETHTPAPRADAHMEIVHTACGHATSTPDVCSRCGGKLLPAEVTWRRSWRTPQVTSLASAEPDDAPG